MSDHFLNPFPRPQRPCLRLLSLNGRAFTLVEILIVIGLVGLLTSMVVSALHRVREMANRAKCSSNLRQIGQGLLLYAIENDGRFPRTYYMPNTPCSDVIAGNRAGLGATYSNPFADSTTVGTNNICAAIFLLLRSQDIGSAVFVCPGQFGASPDTFRRHTRRASRRSNFTNKQRNLGYAMQSMYPFSASMSPTTSWAGNAAGGKQPFRWDLSCATADFALAADQGPHASAGMLRPDSSPAQLRIGNSPNHRRDGQNVLYGDGHVAWQTTSFCGPQGVEYWGNGAGGLLFTGPDNIYMMNRARGASGPAITWANAGSWGGAGRHFVGQPMDANDCLLLPTHARYSAP